MKNTATQKAVKTIPSILCKKRARFIRHKTGAKFPFLVTDSYSATLAGFLHRCDAIEYISSKS